MVCFDFLFLPRYTVVNSLPRESDHKMFLNQNALYYERMASSIGDKARLLPYVEGGNVLEIGFGGGELLDILEEHKYITHGLDASDVSVAKVSDKPYSSRVVEAYANEITGHFGYEYFNSAVLSSVMHEVFSYGNRDNLHKHSVLALEDTLKEIHDSLVPGGRVIIRDGVLSENWEDKVQIVMLNGDVEGVEKYLEMQPFKDRVSLTYQGDNTFLGNLESATAFAYTYTWGESSLERESQELFGVLTQNEYRTLLESNGFSMIHSEEYVQEGYVKALSPKMEFRDMEGNILPFPSTNALWVAEKK